MKKLLSALFALSLVFTGLQSVEAKDKIKIAVEGAYPPFSFYTPEGKLSGFDIDIAYALCEAMNVECELVAVEWDGIIPGLKVGKYDAIIASVSITEERKKQLDFTDKYYVSHARFVVPKKKALDVLVYGLQGKRIGVQRATTHSSYLEDKYKNDLKVSQYDTQESANMDLFNGRIDAVLADSFTISYKILQSDRGKDYTFIGPDINDPQWYGTGEAGICIRKGDDELREKFNNALRIIRDNGKYAEINSKYFPFDIYGDDLAPKVSP